MRFLKYYKGDCYMFEDVRDSVAGNDTCGPTTVLFKNDDETKSKVKYYNKYLKTGNESPIEFTWKYDESNGYPAIIITITKNLITNPNYIICLEYRNMARGSKGSGTGTKYLAPYGNNKAANVYIKSDKKGLPVLDPSFENITYKYVKDLQVGQEYILYLTTSRRYDLYCPSNEMRIRRFTPSTNTSNYYNIRNAKEEKRVYDMCYLYVRPAIRRTDIPYQNNIFIKTEEYKYVECRYNNLKYRWLDNH